MCSLRHLLVSFVVLAASGCRLSEDDARSMKRAFDRAQDGVESGAEQARSTWSRVKADVERREVDWERVRQVLGTAGAEESKGPPRAPSPSSTNEQTDPWWERWEQAIACEDGECRVEQWLVLRAREDPMRLTHGVRVRPVSAGAPGRLSGFRLDRVGPNSPAHRLGFRSGDEIRVVNRQRVTEPLVQMSLWSQLGQPRRYVITFVRGGEDRAIAIDVVEAL